MMISMRFSKSRMCEASRFEAEGNIEFNDFDPSTSENMKEDDQSAMGPISSHDASKKETQFERSNMWYLVPRPGNRTIYELGVYSGISLKKMELSEVISRDWFSKAIIKRKASTMMRHFPPLLEWRLSESL